MQPSELQVVVQSEEVQAALAAFHLQEIEAQEGCQSLPEETQRTGRQNLGLIDCCDLKKHFLVRGPFKKGELVQSEQ